MTMTTVCTFHPVFVYLIGADIRRHCLFVFISSLLRSFFPWCIDETFTIYVIHRLSMFLWVSSYDHACIVMHVRVAIVPQRFSHVTPKACKDCMDCRMVCGLSQPGPALFLKRWLPPYICLSPCTHTLPHTRSHVHTCTRAHYIKPVSLLF